MKEEGWSTGGEGPHAGQPILVRGLPVEHAHAALILLHGRNAGPENIIELAHALDHPAFIYLAPGAAGRTWYPQSFLAPTERNEPYLSSAVGIVRDLVDSLEERGLPRSRVVLLGFSQGACLALTAGAGLLGARRSALGYPGLGGIIGFSGGLIGPPGTRWEYEGDAGGIPVLLGCSDVDPHIPRARVEETARVFEGLGARVTLRIFPGMGHLVNEEELELARALLREAAG